LIFQNILLLMRIIMYYYENIKKNPLGIRT